MGSNATNATVLDTLTGLVWEQEPSVTATYWGWGQTSGGFNSAQVYCGNLTKGGYTDWRLPTVMEMQSLVDYTLPTSPYINGTVFPNTQGYYWTSEGGAACLPPASLCSISTSGCTLSFFCSAWGVSFAISWINTMSINKGGSISCREDGRFGCYPEGSATNAVRCVRGSGGVMFNRYLNEKGTLLEGSDMQVKDSLTGLIWQRQGVGSASWSAAQSYCQLLSLGGQQWRLPKIKELVTLVEYPAGTFNSVAFPVSPSTLWSSSPSNIECSDTGGLCIWSLSNGAVSLSSEITFDETSSASIPVDTLAGALCVRSPSVPTPEPSTPVPSTPVPSTPEPSTPVPSTPEPPTPVPSTPVPPTPVPSTPVPSTPEPPTPVPSTPEPTSFLSAAFSSPALVSGAVGAAAVVGLTLIVFCICKVVRSPKTPAHPKPYDGSGLAEEMLPASAS